MFSKGNTMASILIRAEGTSPTAIPLENSTDCGKQSVLIKGTTREQREQIVRESLCEIKNKKSVRYMRTDAGYLSIVS